MAVGGVWIGANAVLAAKAGGGHLAGAIRVVGVVHVSGELRVGLRRLGRGTGVGVDSRIGADWSKGCCS